MFQSDGMRLQPYMTQARGGRETKGSQSTDQKYALKDLESIYEDDEDPHDENVFAIYRGKLTDQSFHLVDFLNEFGKEKGFDAIIERLSNHKPVMPIKNLKLITLVLLLLLF